MSLIFQKYSLQKYLHFTRTLLFRKMSVILIGQLFKSLVSLFFGIILGVISGLLFSLGAIIITLVRFPINFFKTFKVVILTVVLKRRLKLIVLIALSIIHIIYPIICSVVVIFGSVFGLSVIFSNQIFGGKFNELRDTMEEGSDYLKDYWKAQKKFTSKMVAEYEHPTGIPLNWNGVRYDLPQIRLLQVLKGLFLILYGVAAVSSGTFIILTAKYPFMHAKALKTFVMRIFKWELSFLPSFPFFVFYLLIAIILGPLT